MTGGGEGDHYAELGVSRDASREEIHRAYRRVARRYHPDLNRDPGGAERFAAAAHAYAVLNDPAARAGYDSRFPRPVPIRPSIQPRPAIGRRGVLELTAREAAHIARFPLALIDRRGVRIVVPVGTGDGDQLGLYDRGELIMLDVRVHENDLTVPD